MKKLVFVLCVALSLNAAIIDKDASTWDFSKPGYQVIDVRMPKEWAAKSIDNTYKISIINDDGSVNKNFVNEVLEIWDKKSTLVLMCRSGKRSKKAALALEKSGFSEDIINLAGGIGKVDVDNVNKRK